MADGNQDQQNNGGDEAAKAAAADVAAKAAANGGAGDEASKAEAARVAALTPEQRAAEEKAAADKKAIDDKAAADKRTAYDEKAFKAPEGMTLDGEALKVALPLFKEAGLDQATAQKFVDLYAAQVKAAQDSGSKAWADTIGKWQGELKTSLADSKEFTGAEFGGDRIKELQALTAKAVAAYGGEDAAAITQHMKTYALGDFGPMARFMARVGRTVTEDKVPRGANAATGEVRLADQIYPSMKKE